MNFIGVFPNYELRFRLTNAYLKNDKINILSFQNFLSAPFLETSIMESNGESSEWMVRKAFRTILHFS